MNRNTTLDSTKLSINDPIKEVSLDGMVALKIMQHCRQNIPTPVTGQLLGLDFKGELEVTDSFPLPLKLDEEGEDTGSDHAYEMMKYLRDVNVDNNTVGWYQSTYLGIHINQFLIDTQFSYQSETKASVVIIYDPLTTSHGTSGFRAFRLTDTFMELHKTVGFTRESLQRHNFKHSDIFEEIPIRLRTSGLGEAFLYQLESHPKVQDQFESLDLSTNDFLQKNLEGLLYCLTDFQKEQNVHSSWLRNAQRLEQQQAQIILRRKTENLARKERKEPLLPESLADLEMENPTVFKKPSQPSHLESLLIAQRIDTHCDQIQAFAGQSLTKQFVAKSVHDVGSA